MICKRCGNSNRFFFAQIYCENCVKCFYCLKCARFSIFKICENTKQDLLFTEEEVSYKLKYKLTEEQQNISDMILKNIAKHNIFINATCGAGKTEIVFEVIKRFINKNLKVCFVTPRVEVTNEIYFRMCRAFNMKFGLITGEKKVLTGAMFFMTAHQIINYQDCFDLVIVDEVDAFPLYNDKLLEIALKKSLSKKGRMICMSATPIKVSNNFLELKLKTRYHMQKIPEPVSMKVSLDKLGEIICSGKWIVFFPTIKLLEEIAVHFENVIICHSKVDSVAARIASLKNDFIIFSTAILERGITIEQINVIVYEANHVNFKDSTLIQIAGRVGRVFPYTTGEVIFMHDYTNLHIKRAYSHLRSLNE